MSAGNFPFVIFVQSKQIDKTQFDSEHHSNEQTKPN